MIVVFAKVFHKTERGVKVTKVKSHFGGTKNSLQSNIIPDTNNFYGNAYTAFVSDDGKTSKNTIRDNSNQNTVVHEKWANDKRLVLKHQLDRPLTTVTKRNSTARRYQYHAPFSRTLVGRPFQVDAEVLTSIGFPMKSFVTLNAENVQYFVFVTAASAEYYERLLTLISTIQRQFPDKDILVYDLGLSRNQTNELRNLCYVLVRDYAKMSASFPEHMKIMTSYAWKALVIHDALRETNGVFWVDASIRFDGHNLTRTYEKLVHDTQGAMMFTNAGHSIYAATAKQMYQYIPSRLTQMQRLEQLEANSVMLYRTRTVYTNVIQWLVLCSLDANCISPISRRFCDFNPDRYTEYAHCHRFDQSAVNILLANLHDFRQDDYFSPDDLFDVERGIPPDEIVLTEC